MFTASSSFDAKQQIIEYVKTHEKCSLYTLGT